MKNRCGTKFLHRFRNGSSGNPGEFVHKTEIIQNIIFLIDGVHDASGKFVGARRRSDDSHSLIPGLLPVFPVNGGSHCRMGINDVIRLFIKPGDLSGRLLLRSIIAIEISKLFLHLRGDRIDALL